MPGQLRRADDSSDIQTAANARTPRAGLSRVAVRPAGASSRPRNLAFAGSSFSRLTMRRRSALDLLPEGVDPGVRVARHVGLAGVLGRLRGDAFDPLWGDAGLLGCAGASRRLPAWVDRGFGEFTVERPGG